MAKRRAAADPDADDAYGVAPKRSRTADSDDDAPRATQGPSKRNGKGKERAEQVDISDDDDDEAMQEPDADEEKKFEEENEERIRDRVMNKSKAQGVSAPMVDNIICFKSAGSLFKSDLHWRRSTRGFHCVYARLHALYVRG